MSMEETRHGIRIGPSAIAYDWHGKKRILVAGFDEGGQKRLDLSINGENVYLTAEETAYFLAWMSTWYEQGVVSA